MMGLLISCKNSKNCIAMRGPLNELLVPMKLIEPIESAIRAEEALEKDPVT